MSTLDFVKVLLQYEDEHYIMYHDDNDGKDKIQYGTRKELIDFVHKLGIPRLYDVPEQLPNYDIDITYEDTLEYISYKTHGFQEDFCRNLYTDIVSYYIGLCKRYPKQAKASRIKEWKDIYEFVKKTLKGHFSLNHNTIYQNHKEDLSFEELLPIYKKVFCEMLPLFMRCATNIRLTEENRENWESDIDVGLLIYQEYLINKSRKVDFPENGIADMFFITMLYDDIHDSDSLQLYKDLTDNIKLMQGGREDFLEDVIPEFWNRINNGNKARRYRYNKGFSNEVIKNDKKIIEKYPFVMANNNRSKIITELSEDIKNTISKKPKDIIKPLRAALDAGVIRRPTWTEFKGAFGKDKLKSKSSLDYLKSDATPYYGDESFKLLVEKFKKMWE